MQWRAADQEKFQDGHTVPFDLPAGRDWAEAEVKIPVTGTLIHVRHLWGPWYFCAFT